MDFHALVDKLRKLENAPLNVSAKENCSTVTPQSNTGPISLPPQPDHPPPSLNVNLNAHGMDDIEQMMQLFKKINPDMIPKIDTIPISLPTPASTNLGSHASKMLQDFDSESKPLEKNNDNSTSGNDEVEIIKSLDRDGDGDHDTNDHDLEKDDKKEGLPGIVARAAVGSAISKLDDSDDDGEEVKKEWANTPDTDTKDIDYVVNKLAGGMNSNHSTYPKVSDGDNPMQKVKEEDLRAAIKAELQKRLAEAKGVK